MKGPTWGKIANVSQRAAQLTSDSQALGTELQGDIPARGGIKTQDGGGQTASGHLVEAGSAAHPLADLMDTACAGRRNALRLTGLT